MELGIRRNQLYKWAEQLERQGDKAFGSRGRPKKDEPQTGQCEVT